MTTMNIYAPPGTQVIYSAAGGHDWQIKEADRLLVRDSTYRVERTDVHRMHTDVYLTAFPGLKFNSCLFTDIATTETESHQEGHQCPK